MKFLKKHTLLFSNLLISFLLLLLPYVLFNGKYYISGDDTRFYYIYPFEYFKEFTFSSWHHFSTVGSYVPTQFMVPFLLVWSLLSFLLKSTITLDYLGFSLPIILTFLFLQLFFTEIFSKENKIQAFFGALFFVTSPIILTNQLFIFLSTVWVLPLTPLLAYLFLKYLKSNNYLYVSIAVVSSVVFSLGFFSIPWIAGYILPLSIGLITAIIVFKVKLKKVYAVRSLIFLLIVSLSQSFWFFSFVITYFGKSDASYGTKILSKGVEDTFAPTVLATAHGNIIYPLLNLFHRQIAFDFGWALKEVFVEFYDKVFYLNIFYIILLFIPLLFFQKKLKEKEKPQFLIFLISFIFSLYFFTVNIGILKQTFLFFGKIPGFVMFRNFYDKFAPAYVFFYSALIIFSLILLKRKNRKIYFTACFILTILTFLNFSQVGNIVNAPLWQTKDIGRNIMIPDEYLEFMSNVKKTVPSTNTIFTFPFGTALYSVIKDTNSDSVYTGTSPVKILSGVNDVSGNLSFFFSNSNGIIEYLIINKDYKGIEEMLRAYNINYLFVNYSIPKNVVKSWIFDKRMIASQDREMINMLSADEPLLTSKNKNYELYKLKNPNTLLESKGLSYKKVNEIKYKLYIHGIKNNQKLFFHDSYHPDWELFINSDPSKKWCDINGVVNNINECVESNTFLEGDELGFSFRKPVFLETHKNVSKFNINQWTIQPEVIKKNYSQNFYHENKDGSIDLELTLYFTPQNYFYFGSIISTIVLIFNGVFIFYWLFRKIYEIPKK